MLFGAKKTFVIDYDTLGDPRIAEFLALGLIAGRVLVPEPPQPSDAANDHAVRRAWETIDRLKGIKDLTVKLDKTLMTRKNKATLITTSPELKAACGELPCVTATQIYMLFKPAYLPGTAIKLKIAKKGKEKDEGIGYLEGGIKVVVENAAHLVGSELEVVIQGALDTDVGQVVFAKPRFTEVR
jgi:uncharacterized protein YacL